MYGKWIDKALIRCVDCLAGLLSNDRTWRTPSTSHDIAWLFEIKLGTRQSCSFSACLPGERPDCWHLDGLERRSRSWVLLFTTTSHLQLIGSLFPLFLRLLFPCSIPLPPISGLSPVSFPIRPSEIVRLLYRYFPTPSPNRRNIVFLPISLFFFLYIPLPRSRTFSISSKTLVLPFSIYERYRIPRHLCEERSLFVKAG